MKFTDDKKVQQAWHEAYEARRVNKDLAKKVKELNKLLNPQRKEAQNV